MEVFARDTCDCNGGTLHDIGVKRHIYGNRQYIRENQLAFYLCAVRNEIRVRFSLTRS